MSHLADWVSLILITFFAMHLMVKFLGVVLFFRRPVAPEPPSWERVTLIQPITRSGNDLARALQSRFRLDYPGLIQHILVCDANDLESQSVCRSLLTAFPRLRAHLLLVEGTGGPVASKIEKILAALPCVQGDTLCFVDDDVILPPSALSSLVAPLHLPGVGAVFGLACYTNWRNLWSGLISSFVNSHALLSYIPLTYLTEPFTITGHCFAMRRSVFLATGALRGMGNRADDDHELARATKRLGLRLLQTPLIYEVDNYLSSFHAYRAQMKRWFVMPRQSMLPGLTRKESMLMMLTGADIWVPLLLAVLALVPHRPGSLLALMASLGILYVVNELCGRLYTGHPTPRRWLFLPVLSAILAPVLILLAIFGDDHIEWRGQRLRLHRGGQMESIG